MNNVGQPRDDERAHHRGAGCLQPLELGLEFDYRLYWLRSAEGGWFAVMGNLVDTACGVPNLLAPWVAEAVSRTTLTVAVFDPMSGDVQQDSHRGELDDEFRFSSTSGWLSDWGPGSSRLSVASADFAVDLRTESKKPAALFVDEAGVNGAIFNGPLGRFDYVQYTSLSCRGTVLVRGREYEVQGWAWRDRQWMRWKLTSSPQPCAWRWFAIQLEEPAQELMIYEMWNVLTGRVFKRYAGVVDAESRVRALAGSDFSIEVLETESGPRRVERSWRLSLPALDGLSLELRRTAGSPWIHADAGLLRHDYLEGPCRVLGTERPARAWAEQLDLRWMTFAGIRSGTHGGLATP